MFPTWQWTRSPSRRYLTFSYSDVNTIRDNIRCRDIITSDWYQSNYDLRLSSSQSAKIRFDTVQRGYRIASSVEGQGVGEHPDCIIIDDPVKADVSTARSPIMLQKCSDWYSRTVSTRLNRNPAIILVMQRLHLKDLTGRLLAKDPGGWHHLCLPMEYEPEHLDAQNVLVKPDPRDPRREPGELLWPANWSGEKLRGTKLFLGPFGVAGQLQQRPVPEGGGLFKRDYFKIVDSAPADTKWCRGWDIAETEEEEATDKSNWTVGVKMGYHRESGKWYISHVVRQQSTLTDSLIKTTAETDGKKCKIREGAGSGKATIAAHRIMLAGYDYDKSPETDSKIERAAPFRAQAEGGNVHLIKGDWNEVYLDIVCSFPVGVQDDDVDASSNAFNELVGTKRSTGLVWKVKPRIAMGGT